MPYANSKDLEQPAHPCFIRGFNVFRIMEYRRLCDMNSKVPNQFAHIPDQDFCYPITESMSIVDFYL